MQEFFIKFVSAISSIMCRINFSRVTILLIHISFIFIVAGGVCTALFSHRGSLHLYPGETSGAYIRDDLRVAPLPVRVTLLSFDIDRYRGSDLPKDYRSTILTTTGDTIRISINRIGRLPYGCRLIQTSFDEYGGTWLTVAQDPVGTALAYFGFILFAIGSFADLTLRLCRRDTRRPVIYALSVAFLCLAACFVFLNPRRDGTLPVLATWWLPVHVAFCFAGYATLLATLPMAIAAAWQKKRERLLSLALAIAAPGVLLLGVGIIIGAVWANVSWGRYWDWDPKETSALVTFLVYSIPLHLRLFCPSAIMSPIALRAKPSWSVVAIILLIFGALSMTMTFLGVSYLPSLHSYL